MIMKRRGFLKQSMAAAIASGPFIGNVRGANDRLGIGIIGLGSRGNYELRTCAGLGDVQVLALAEVYQPLLDRALSVSPGKPSGYQDFRRILERKDIDAVFVSTPDHWHAPAAIMACQAGKDVYCEKPLSHTIHEGRMMVQAARRYNRNPGHRKPAAFWPNIFRRSWKWFRGVISAAFRQSSAGTPAMSRRGCRQPAGLRSAARNGLGHVPRAGA